MNILITGEKSYIGGHLREYLSAKGHKCKIVSVREALPVTTGFDAVVHCAGIVHKKANKRLYDDINVKLSATLAKSAKESGVGHFIFMSSMSVYGKTGSRMNIPIDEITPAEPDTDYGKSKLEAEKLLTGISGEDFIVSNLRLPMVYGKDCPGNYSALSKLVNILPVFPYVENERSMLYIDNLGEFVHLLIQNPPKKAAVYCPQNKETICTSELVKLMADRRGRKISQSRLLGILAARMPFKSARKLFGNLVYDRQMSNYFSFEYCVVNFEETVE